MRSPWLNSAMGCLLHERGVAEALLEINECIESTGSPEATCSLAYNHTSPIIPLRMS